MLRHCGKDSRGDQMARGCLLILLRRRAAFRESERMKQQRKQLEFQVNGPYRDYTLRWVRLHRENNQRLLLVLVPTVRICLPAILYFC